MTDTSQSQSEPLEVKSNGVNGDDGGTELLTEDERSKMRPADIDADVREMERRKRVEVIMNSRLFREELERIIEMQMEGNGPGTVLQQISDMMGIQSGKLHSNHLFKGSNCVTPINDIRGVESMGYAKGEKALRCKMASVFRLMDLYGWSQGLNNILTARLNMDEELFLVNPHGMLFNEITASSLVKVDMQGAIVETGTTNFGVNVQGFLLHSAIHASRPDLKCIIHIHTPSVLAVSSLKCGLLPICQEALVIGEVSQHPFVSGIFEPEEREKIIRNLGPSNKVLFLNNHGALCCGATVEEAFYNVYNTVLACETQMKLMPVGVDNLVLVDDETRKQVYDAARRAPEPAPGTKVKQLRVGELEFEALIRMLDNAGFRTGYIYRHPLVKGELPKPKNDVELPPAVSSLGYLIEEEELYRSGNWKKYVDGRNRQDRSKWLNSPNVYQKVEILETGTPDPKKITKWVEQNSEEWVADGSPTHSSTPVKIDSALQFVPKGTNPKEFKKIQQQIKTNRLADKITSGPQSHILEGVSWEEAKKMQDANMTQTGDQVILVGAASKGIIQRNYQHNAMVYKTPYAKNPFDSISDKELEDYKKLVERRQRGDTDYEESQSESEAISSSRQDAPRHIKSPLSPQSATSETEEESRDEPRVLRIETKTAPRPIQAEVVLSDAESDVIDARVERSQSARYPRQEKAESVTLINSFRKSWSLKRDKDKSKDAQLLSDDPDTDSQDTRLVAHVRELPRPSKPKLVEITSFQFPVTLQTNTHTNPLPINENSSSPVAVLITELRKALKEISFNSTQDSDNEANSEVQLLEMPEEDVISVCASLLNEEEKRAGDKVTDDFSTHTTVQSINTQWLQPRTPVCAQWETEIIDTSMTSDITASSGDVTVVEVPETTDTTQYSESTADTEIPTGVSSRNVDISLPCVLTDKDESELIVPETENVVNLDDTGIDVDCPSSQSERSSSLNVDKPLKRMCPMDSVHTKAQKQRKLCDGKTMDITHTITAITDYVDFGRPGNCDIIVEKPSSILDMASTQSHDDHNAETIVYESNANPETIVYESNANPETIVYESNTNPETIVYESNANPETIAYESNANPETIAYESNANPETIVYESNANPEIIVYESNANPETIVYESNANPETIVYESNANPETIVHESNTIPETIVYDSNAYPEIIVYESNADPETIVYESNAYPETIVYESNANAETIAYESNANPETIVYESNANPETNVYESNTNAETIVYESNANTETGEYLCNANVQTAEYLNVANEDVQESGKNIINAHTDEYLNSDYVKSSNKEADQNIATSQHIIDKEGSGCEDGKTADPLRRQELNDTIGNRSTDIDSSNMKSSSGRTSNDVDSSIVYKTPDTDFESRKLIDNQINDLSGALKTKELSNIFESPEYLNIDTEDAPVTSTSKDSSLQESLPENAVSPEKLKTRENMTSSQCKELKKKGQKKKETRTCITVKRKVLKTLSSAPQLKEYSVTITDKHVNYASEKVNVEIQNSSEESYPATNSFQACEFVKEGCNCQARHSLAELQGEVQSTIKQLQHIETFFEDEIEKFVEVKFNEDDNKENLSGDKILNEKFNLKDFQMEASHDTQSKINISNMEESLNITEDMSNCYVHEEDMAEVSNEVVLPFPILRSPSLPAIVEVDEESVSRM